MDGWTLVCFVVVIVVVGVVIVVVAAVITVTVFVNPVVVIFKGVGLRLTSAGLSKGLSGLLSVRALRPKQCPPARVHLVLADAGVLTARERKKTVRKEKSVKKSFSHPLPPSDNPEYWRSLPTARYTGPLTL